MVKKQQEIERLNKELESWIKLINYNEIEDIPQYIEDLEVDNKSLKKENKEINKENKRLNNIIKEAIETLEVNIEECNYDSASVCALEILEGGKDIKL